MIEAAKRKMDKMFRDASMPDTFREKYLYKFEDDWNCREQLLKEKKMTKIPKVEDYVEKSISRLVIQLDMIQTELKNSPNPEKFWKFLEYADDAVFYLFSPPISAGIYFDILLG